MNKTSKTKRTFEVRIGFNHGRQSCRHDAGDRVTSDHLTNAEEETLLMHEPPVISLIPEAN